jgi:hypothetical protein
VIAALTQSGGTRVLAAAILAACAVLWFIEMRARDRAARRERVRDQFGRTTGDRR